MVWDHRWFPYGRHWRVQARVPSRVSVLLWIVFFMVDDKARKRIDGEGNTAVVVDLLTLTGTFLAVFTLLGVGFFAVIAPRIP